MEESNTPHFLTTPIKKPTTTTTPMGPVVSTPNTRDRASPSLSTRARNSNVALSITDVRRKALQLRKGNNSGPGCIKPSPNKVVGFGTKKDGSGSGSLKPAPILAEKHQILCDFFVAMLNSIRLLRLKGVPPTLTKLASNIESLTDRRFTLHHLAQMKHIVPEVIVVKKIRIHDDKTKCMKEDLLLSMEMDAMTVDNDAKVGDGFSQLKKMFRTRVVEFSKTHSEDDDIPEGELPHLFHQPKQELEPNSNNTSATPLVASLIAPSFKMRFSSKRLGGQVSESTLVKQSTCLPETPSKELAAYDPNDGPCSSTVEADEALLCPASTPDKLGLIPQKLASTPAELASTPARLMSATSALRTPKRTLTSSDNDICELTNKPAKRRSLKFDESSVEIEDQLNQVDEDNFLPALGSMIAKDDVLTVLPENLLQLLIKKEQKITEEKDPIVAWARRRQQMMAGVPKLFDMIRLLFQSIRRTVITKEELVYKLLSGHVDIIDRVKVEEQLKLLQELAPEYISEQISLSGDTLVSLNKYSSAESVRAKLLEAS